ncbi:MAG: serine/threonine protein kinase [Proteobacteria bacterium]|nr:serine/threonine protein kinase [Pseudomonadota bacterium]
MATSEDDQLRLAPGTVLDSRYRIVAPIKAGGMGAVYRAVDLEVGEKTCAIKEMLDQFESPSDRQAGIDRFLREIQVMEHMAHANIPRVTDHFVENNNFYFVMEFIEGIDLSTILKEQGSPGLPWERAVEWGIQVCDALSYTHSLKPEPVVHRDIKPSNLMLRHSDGRILIVDFGIARVTNPGPNLWIGTREYAPPEQQLRKHIPCSDLFALGVTMHELITGAKPDGFYIESFEEMGRTDLPASLWEALRHALQLNPDYRYQTATDMRDALIRTLGYTPHVAHDEGFAFSEKVQRLKDVAIEPPLRLLISRYGNECHTPHLPRKLERLVFTLGAETPFQLIIQVNEPNGCIDFVERQGILDPVSLGAVAPDDEAAQEQVKRLIDLFVRDYESFKNANWQLMF